MTNSKLTLGVPLLISAALYIGSLIVNCVFVTEITLHGGMRGWFLPCIGLLLLPSVILQLVSAIMLLLEKGDKLSVTSSVAIAVLHIFQLGFIWRHNILFREVEPNSRVHGQTHLKYLQILFAFTTSLPMSFILCFILVHYRHADLIIVIALAVSFVTSCWYISSFRKTTRDEDFTTSFRLLPGKLCRLSWRFGELTSRIISLIVFASVYYYWIFLILGLHTVTMLVCLCTTVLGMFEKPGASKTYKALCGLLLAYMYSFCFINLSSDNSVFRYTVYYTIMLLENGILTFVWFIHADQTWGLLFKVILVSVSSCAYVIGIIALVLYYKCFHTVALFDADKERIYESESCINCKLSVCSKHCIKLQRPFSAGWITQYQKATSSGQYYRNILQDTLFDSEGEHIPDTLNSSGEHWQIRDTDLESIRTTEKKQYLSVQASGTYTHKRFFDSDSSIAKMSDTDSIASGSGVYDEDWRRKSDTILSQLSAMDALSLVSSNTRLLTDSWDTLIQESSDKSENQKHPKKIDILNSLIRQDLDTSFFSDGYLTDHTLDSYQLPVTVLAKQRQVDRRKAEPAYSTASDSTDCTICAFMRQHQSSPESSRRSFEINENFSEDTHLRMLKRKKHQYIAAKRANRHKRINKKSQEQVTLCKSYPHKYEKSASRQRRRELIRVSDFTSLPNSNKCHVPCSNQIQSRKKSSIKLSGFDTSFDKCKKVLNDSFSSATKIPTNVPIAISSVRSPSSDSGDSAFPRNTPVSDVTDRPNNLIDIDLLCSNVLKQRSDSRTKRVQEVPKSSSGVSVSTRQNSLTAYLAAADGENDGTSESSCEMII